MPEAAGSSSGTLTADNGLVFGDVPAGYELTISTAISGEVNLLADYSASTTCTILSGSCVPGSFDPLVSTNFAFLDAALSYSAADVLLTLTMVLAGATRSPSVAGRWTAMRC
ncbi:hypothetical protein Ga0061067_11224 [Pannonibacter indicus]|uniref:Uncharacterized protein n=2 Tax=Pannonibacter indicus TaxID=466044 RepID=A0A0K6I7P8_9HYPH|nr:hypothetical protein Ga0061067_11224 [Pannonibacter indicus]